MRLPVLLLLTSALFALPLSGQQQQTPERIVAIGDLHGDYSAATRALRLAGAINDEGNWVGGKMVVVQTGDILDRGDGEREILALFTKLSDQARKAGGDIHLLNGNHELMNVYFDFRYVTDSGFRKFADETAPTNFALPPSVTENQRGRALAFRPGGPLAGSLATRPTMLVLHGTAYAHGGILPAHAKQGIEQMNNEIQQWLLGKAALPGWLRNEHSPVWTRLYSRAPNKEACDAARETLALIGAKKMVVGHTVHRDGITSYCDGLVWAIDVGMSKYYGGPTQVLELRGDSVQILKAEPIPQ